MRVFMVIICFALLYLVRLPGLLPKEYRRDLIVFTVLMGLAFVISALGAAGIRLPYVTTEMLRLFKNVFHQ